LAQSKPAGKEERENADYKSFMVSWSWRLSDDWGWRIKHIAWENFPLHLVLIGRLSFFSFLVRVKQSMSN
jgi:hypothetical protein